MSIRKTILLLNANYIPVVFFWMASFNKGPFALLLMLPISILCLTANYLLSEGRKSAFLWCLNLMAAEALGIALHNYLFLNFSGGNDFGIWNAAIEFMIMMIVLLPGTFLVARLNEARYKRRLSRLRLRDGGRAGEEAEDFDKEDVITDDFYGDESESDEDDTSGESEPYEDDDRYDSDSEEDDDMYDSEPESEDDDWDEDLLSSGVDREIDDEINDGFPAVLGKGSYSAPKPKKGRRVIIKNK